MSKETSFTHEEDYALIKAAQLLIRFYTLGNFAYAIKNNDPATLIDAIRIFCAGEVTLTTSEAVFVALRDFKQEQVTRRLLKENGQPYTSLASTKELLRRNNA